VSSAPQSLAPVLSRVLAAGIAVSDHETDQRIMDAVVAELLVTPLRKLAVEDVAGRAGLTRMTVYRRFGDREGLIEAAIAREIARFLDGVSDALDPDSAPTEQIAEAFAAGLRLAHEHDLVRHWLRTSPGDLLDLILADDALTLVAGAEFLAARIVEMTPGRKPAVDPERAGELLTRLFAALVLMPPAGIDLADPDEARQLARDLIAPLILSSR
jgi:AcrR family transcriptional regulator